MDDLKTGKNVNPEEVIKLTREIQGYMQDTSKSVSEIKEKMPQMEKDLNEKLGLVDSQVSELKTNVQKLTKEKEEAENKVFEKILFDAKANNPKLYNTAKVWGYHANPIEKALYMPCTKYNRGIGWTENGKSYGVDNQLAAMNDFLVIFGMWKSFQSQNTGEFKTAKQVIKNLDTYKMFINELKRDNELRKALATDNTGEGAEWIPTQMSAQLIDAIRLELKVAGLFDSITMPARTGEWRLPYNPSTNTAYLVPESGTDNPTKIPAGQKGTDDLTLSAVKHALRLIFSYEIEEDSIVPMMPLIMNNLRDSLARAQEYSIVNGDKSTTHQDSDVTSAMDAQKSWNGLRKEGLAGSGSVDGSTFGISSLRNCRKAMGTYGVDPSQLGYITGVAAYIKMLSFDEVETVDKFGSEATVKTGVLAMVDGTSVTVSPAVRQDLNGSGVYDGATTTKTTVICANTRAFWNFEKPSSILIENARDIETQQNVAVASRRVGFKKMMTAGTDEKVANVIYNISK